MSSEIRFDVAFTVPANAHGLHFTVFYLSNITEAERKLALDHYYNMVKTFYRPDSNGRYMISYVNRFIWGNTILLDGPIFDFKKFVYSYMSQIFPNRLSWRDPHVTVNGNHDAQFYPSFNMLQISTPKVLHR